MEKIVSKNKEFVSYKTKNKLINIIVYTILITLSIIWVLPIVWIILQSFDDRPYAFVSYVIPKNWSFSNYIKLFTITDSLKFPIWLMNTFFVAVVSCVISTFSVLLVSYAFSKLRFKGRVGIMKLLMIIGMFPGFMSMIIVYYLFKAIGLYQSLFSLILVYSGGAAMGYFVSKGFFDTIPKDIQEAAKIDGANNAQIFLKITLPLAKPIVVYTILTSFVGPWGDYMLVNILMGGNTEKWNVALGLYNMINRYRIDEYFTVFAAGAVIIAIPITLLFIFMQKYYVEGITGGSGK